MSQDTVGIMNAVKSEQLLAGSVILVQIEELRQSLQYRSDGDVFSYDNYFLILQKQIDDLPRVNLESEIAPHTEGHYQIRLVTALECVFDDCERITTKMYHFLSKLKVAQERMETLKASFTAWYSLAASQLLSHYDLNLGKTVISDLARAEFERLIGGLDVEVSSLVEAVQVQIKTVTKRKQTAQEKFNLGKDQANAVWTSSLLPGNIGTNSDEGSRDLLEPSEDEEEINVPDFVSKQPQIDEIRGVFTKRGDASEATPIGEIAADNDNN